MVNIYFPIIWLVLSNGEERVKGIQAMITWIHACTTLKQNLFWRPLMRNNPYFSLQNERISLLVPIPISSHLPLPTFGETLLINPQPTRSLPKCCHCIWGKLCRQAMYIRMIKIIINKYYTYLC
jgi:hypothetical protein